MKMSTDFEYRATGHEHVTASVSTMESIPAGSNPFNHDLSSMGTNLVRGWIIMHDGFDSADEPQALTNMYMVNTRTGQRIKINLEHEPSPGQLAEQKAKRDADDADFAAKVAARQAPIIAGLNAGARTARLRHLRGGGTPQAVVDWNPERQLVALGNHDNVYHIDYVESVE